MGNCGKWEKIVLGINHFMFLHPHCGIASQENQGGMYIIQFQKGLKVSFISILLTLFAVVYFIVLCFSWRFDHVWKGAYQMLLCMYVCNVHVWKIPAALIETQYFLKSMSLNHKPLILIGNLGIKTPPGGPLVFQGGYHPRKKIHVIGSFFRTKRCTRVHRLGYQKHAKLKKRTV